MKTLSLLALGAVGLAAALVALPVVQAQGRVLAIGADAPLTDVALRNVDNRQLTVQQVRGERGTLVVFTCNHCPYAQQWEARLTAIGNEFRSRGIGVIAVNPNDPNRIEEDGFDEMVRRHRAAGMQFPYVVDPGSRLAAAYGATKTPEVYLFDRAMHLVYHGAIDDSVRGPGEAHYLRDALRALLAGRPVNPATTRSVGCGIRFPSGG